MSSEISPGTNNTKKYIVFAEDEIPLLRTVYSTNAEVLRRNGHEGLADELGKDLVCRYAGTDEGVVLVVATDDPLEIAVQYGVFGRNTGQATENIEAAGNDAAIDEDVVDDCIAHRVALGHRAAIAASQICDTYIDAAPKKIGDEAEEWLRQQAPGDSQ
jgi:hypothetical protein